MGIVYRLKGRMENESKKAGARVSMQEVAARAGVSVATVSRALGGRKGQVAAATRRAVEDAAAQLGYVRDPALQALVHYRRSRRPSDGFTTVAVVSAYDTTRDHRIGYFIGEAYLKGLYERLEQLGFKVARFDVGLHMDRQRGAEVRRILRHRGIQSVVFAPVGPRRNMPGLPFDLDGFSVVGFGHWAFHHGLHSVGADHYANMQRAYRHLWEAGYRRIGFIARRFLEWGHGDPLRGAFLSQQAQLLPSGENIPLIFWTPGIQESLSAWIERYRPEVVLTQLHNHIVRMREMGFRIPGDFSAVNVSLPCESGMAGIHVNGERVGHEAAEMVQMLLQRGELGLPRHPMRTLVPGTWSDGDTLG